MTAGPPLLDIQDLDVRFEVAAGSVHAVRGLSLAVQRGEVAAIVGESGSGKSAAMLAALGLLDPNATVRGSVRLDGIELIGAPGSILREMRGGRIGMIFQDPMTSLNPVLTVGRQVAEAVITHQKVSPKVATSKSVELLEMVSMPDAKNRYRAYPHELSGGMRQRVMIAMALANEPDILIADEPTTALDVTIQAQILEVLRDLQAARGLTIVLITHDLGVVAGLADTVHVMYAGNVVEGGPVVDVFHRSNHPYTRGLLDCLPRLDRPERELVPIGGVPPSLRNEPEGCAFVPRCRHAVDTCTSRVPALQRVGTLAVACDVLPFERAASAGSPVAGDAGGCSSMTATDVPTAATAHPLLSVRDLVKAFAARRASWRDRHPAAVQAVSGVSFDVHRNETLSLVGESGCGKSTTARCVLRLVEPTSGSVRFDGIELTTQPSEDLRRLRRHFQMVFQDPHASLNPRMTVGEIVGEPLVVHGSPEPEVADRVAELLELVQLGHGAADRHPHQFSGGQRQRIGIARALALRPDLVALDEPVSALDVSIQAEIIGLLQRLRDELGLAYLFIAHDLSVVRHLSDRVAVMYLGKIVETGTNCAALRCTGAPVHLGAAVGGADPRPADRTHTGADRAGRRPAQRSGPAIRLPVPHSLLEGAGPVARRPNRSSPTSATDNRSPVTSPCAEPVMEPADGARLHAATFLAAA